MHVSVPVQRFDDPVVRPTANYCPNVWGDRFLTYTSYDAAAYECNKQKIEELKEKVKKELKACAGKSPELLKLIDSIQLLGLAYHFERDIQEALKDMRGKYGLVDDNEDLTNTSLRFRLLRQEGYPISSDIFNKFKDKEGNFKESLIGDSLGMLALYEATYLMVDGEEILEEALVFTTTHLQSMATDPNNPLAERVIRALKRPIRKGLTRVEARNYISIYQQDDSHNKSLLVLAKLDFNLLQSLHRKELSEISRWWKALDFETKLPFARHRIVESYFWGLGVYFDPQYFLALKFITKIIALMTIVDDIYDAYGTFEEHEALTEAIERFDASCIDQLPADYLKCCYKAVLDVYEEMEEEMAKKGKLYRVHYTKELMKRQFQSYFLEAKWLNQQYTPTFDEYISNALVSTCFTFFISISCVGMGDEVTEEAFQCLLDRAKVIRASETICRLMDDILSDQFEQSRMHIPTGVECYMKQHGVTKMEACDVFNKKIVKAWKDINQESLIPTQVPMPVARIALNLSRVMDVLYMDGDEYTQVGNIMKDLIVWVLIDPVPM